MDGGSAILNVGAGTGSYEPDSKLVIAVEPSTTMISQRRQGASPVVQAFVESLPFRAASFDAVLGVAIPEDCVDSFLAAYWKRPSAYLDPEIRKGISTFAKVGDISSQLERLTTDIRDGSWDER